MAVYSLTVETTSNATGAQVVGVTVFWEEDPG